MARNTAIFPVVVKKRSIASIDLRPSSDFPPHSKGQAGLRGGAEVRTSLGEMDALSGAFDGRSFLH